MARYDYRCMDCGRVFEVEHPMGEHPDIACPVCGGPAEHVFAASSISFHGSGFYNTDQRGSKASTPATSAPEKKPSKCDSCPHKKD